MLTNNEINTTHSRIVHTLKLNFALIGISIDRRLIDRYDDKYTVSLNDVQTYIYIHTILAVCIMQAIFDGVSTNVPPIFIEII